MHAKSFRLAVVCVVSLALPSWAHHSHGNYDTTQWTPFQGTVKEVHWLNPHSWIYIDIKDDKDQVTTWALEAASPRQIQDKGVKRDDVRPGDLIKVRCHVLRDGTNGCLLGFVTPLHGDPARGHGIEREWD